MGAHPYWYTVPYQPDISEALHALRDREFQAGRYNPVIPFPEFPITDSSPAPGRGHESIDEALAETDADGTRSILDIASIAAEPNFCVAYPIAEETLLTSYGTKHPTREMVESNMEPISEIERGHAVYILLYAEGVPTEILFAGCSFD